LSVLPSGRSLLVGFALLGAALALYLGARQSDVFAVRSIEVATEPAGQSRNIRRALRPLAGTNLLRIDEATIARRLEDLPHVHLLGYDRAFPDGLRIHVSVERAVGVLRRGSERWLVSAEGRVLRKLEAPLRRPLPVVWLPRVVEPEIGAVLRNPDSRRAVAALAAVHETHPRFARRVWYVETEDAELTVVLRDHFEVRLGAAAELGAKLAAAYRVTAAIATSDTVVTYVDVSVPARPVVGADSQVSDLGLDS
jgi:cell division septal protein FtsQ